MSTLSLGHAAPVSALWRDRRTWTRKSILNTAGMGKFSYDRSIHDYCERVWGIQPQQ
jgi:starch phosphorylase